MFLLSSISQLPNDAPDSFTALQWVMVLMLSGALVYVFRQWQQERKNCQARYLETIDKLLRAIEDEADSAGVN